nr:MAG TPA: hypothetical protein [Caudoviricetes sp.]
MASFEALLYGEKAKAFFFCVYWRNFKKKYVKYIDNVNCTVYNKYVK